MVLAGQPAVTGLKTIVLALLLVPGLSWGDQPIRLAAGKVETHTRKAAEHFTGKRLHLVQFDGPIQPAWRAALAAEVQIVDYVPENAYLVYGDAHGLAKLPGVAHVHWDGSFRGEHKIHPGARLKDEKGEPCQPTTDLFAIQLVAGENDATLALIDRLKQQPIRRQSTFGQYRNLFVHLRPEDLETIADQPDVISIQPSAEPAKQDERQAQICAGNLAGTPGYLAWLAGKGFTQAQFTASGFIVDISDSGIDNGTTTPGHFALYAAGNSSLASRVAYNRLEGVPNFGSSIQGCDGHGTLNTHIVAGYDAAPAGFPHTDAGGFYYGLGICPFVKVGSSVIFDPNTFTNPSYENLMARAYRDGARISNNSWGVASGAGYNSDSQLYDALVRDAQPANSAVPAAGNQEMVIVFSDGDDGPTAGSVTAPATGKNILTVGASENVRSMSTANGGNNTAGKDGCDTFDTDADNANDIAIFSARGPCSDGRRKPDLVAPGSHIVGGVAQTSPPPSGTGSALMCFDAAGICGLPGGTVPVTTYGFFPSGQQFFSESSGTSHAAPAVAGACALLRQYFINQGLTPPSPAMTKAFLMNSARYLTGSGANDNLWSNNQGMGALNLGMAFDGAHRMLRDQLAADKFTAGGQTRTFTGTITDATKPFRVTLAWTDAPGNTIGGALNNDLDLTVTVGGATYKGNVFQGAQSVTGGSVDHLNNVESVFLPAGTSGSFTITITAANINSDGVPGNADALDQDFALVIYNAANTPVANVILAQATLTQESCLPTNGVIDPGETVTASFTLTNIGTAATANLTATLTGGSAQSYGILAPGGAAVSRNFTFTAAGNCGGTVTNSLLLQDGASALGTATVVWPLGKRVTVLAEDFDSVNVPGLPGGWTSTATGAQSTWTTVLSAGQSAPNATFSASANAVGVNELVSPTIHITSTTAQLAFSHNFDLEDSSLHPDVAYDGAVLEIQIASGSFTDIVAAGGSFIENGYDHVITNAYNNPLSGRAVWSGTSPGFITTTLNLPASAAGHDIRLRWRCGTDKSAGLTGWYVDGVRVTEAACCLANCQYSLSATSLTVNATGGNASLTVFANPNGCPWTATSQSAFISITSGTSPVEFSVAANQESGTRTGTLLVAGQTVTVIQPALLTSPVVDLPVITNALHCADDYCVLPAGIEGVFVADATDTGGQTLRFRWDFGDGNTTDWSTNPVTTHTYVTNCSPRLATVTVSNATTSATATRRVIVAGPLNLTKLQLTANFSKPAADRVSLLGKFPAPCPAWTPAGQALTFIVGNAPVDFTLDTRARATGPFGSCRLTYSRTTQLWTLSATLQKGNWRESWADFGLTNTNTPRPYLPVNVPAGVLFDDTAVAATKSLRYVARTGRTGTAR